MNLTNKTIAFYISSHGFAHLTRCLAIIEAILIESQYTIYICSGKAQNVFAGAYLSQYSDRIKLNSVTTDIGLINKPNTLEVDLIELSTKLKEYVEDCDNLINSEIVTIKENNLELDLIVSDISPLGFFVADRLNIKSVGISNFTWIDQYEHIGIQQDILKYYYEGYEKCQHFLKYSLALELKGISCITEEVGFVSRSFDVTRIQEIKEKYGKILFVSCGRSANLDVNIDGFDGTIIYTDGINIDAPNAIKLPLNISDTHNFIVASEMVIAKAGWGTTSEAVCANAPLVLIERPGVIEDTHIIDKIKSLELGISISENRLQKIDYKSLRGCCESINKDSIKKFCNNSTEIGKRLITLGGEHGQKC